MSIRQTIEGLKNKAFPKGVPNLYQLKSLFSVFSKNEKSTFLLLTVLFVASGGFLTTNFYQTHTEISPGFGGEYIEGIIGQPRFINPLYSVLNDADRDLTQLLFSGLLDYSENGKLVPVLAKSYRTIDEQQKVYEVELKDGLFWSDGQPFTVDDVVFTIEIIQDPDFNSPLRASWLGVDVKRVSSSVIRFSLDDPYPSFIENLTVKILPSHIWKSISSDNFPLSAYNLSPVTLGAYQLEKIEQSKDGTITSATLLANPKSPTKTPYIEKFIFRFFTTEESLMASVKKKEVDGFSATSPQNYETSTKAGYQAHSFLMPRYFAVFFNPTRKDFLSDENIRKAINYATDKNELINSSSLEGKATLVDSPILPSLYEFSEPDSIYEYDLEEANSLLKDNGYELNDQGVREKKSTSAGFSFKTELKLGSQGEEVRKLQECLADTKINGSDVYPGGKVTGFFGNDTKEAVIRFQEKYRQDILDPQGLTNGTGAVSKATRDKLNDLCLENDSAPLLSFELATVNQPFMIEIAELLKQQWLKAGINIEIKTYESGAIEKEIIKPRNYDALLFGEVLTMVPDPFLFWHSSQKKDPGLNLSLFENKEADKLLEEARRMVDLQKKAEKLVSFQNKLINSAPAVFLYSPDYLYFSSNDLHGVQSKVITDPSRRFLGIADWYVKTERKWK